MEMPDVERIDRLAVRLPRGFNVQPIIDAGAAPTILGIAANRILILGW